MPTTTTTTKLRLALLLLLSVWTNVLTASSTNVEQGEEDARETARRLKDSFESSSPRITNGEDADSQRYPYMVSLQRLSDLSHFCGGTLVAPDLVLTTNECVVTTTASEIAVRVGGFSITNPLPDSELFAVNSIIARPSGGPNDGTSTAESIISNDLAVLVLSGTSQHPYVRLNENFEVSLELQPLLTMGWGTTIYEFPTTPALLQQVDVTAIGNELCVSLSNAGGLGSYANLLTNDLMCAVHDVRGPCTGDLGVLASKENYSCWL